MSIPKKIHRVWLGGPMPEEFARFEQQWIDLHPGWEVHTWTEAELGWLQNRRAFDDAPLLSSKANIARYEIVHREGGLYVDTDYEPLRSFDDLLDGSDLVLAEEEPGMLANALFGATPGHPVLAAAVAGLSASHFARAGEISPQRTGPHYWTRTVRRAMAEHPEVQAQVLTREQVLPYSWKQPHLRHASFPHAWAVHHWAKSWVAADADRGPVARAVRDAGRDAAVGLKRVVRQARTHWDRLEPAAARGERIVPVYLGNGDLLCVTSHGIPLLVPAGDPTLVPALVLDGEIDRAGALFLRAAVRDGDVVVDVGAGVGAVTLQAAWVAGRMGRVFAFEHDQRSAALLRRSVAMNRQRGLEAEVTIATNPVGCGEDATALDVALRGVPEIGLLRIAADPSNADALASATELIGRRAVRLLDIQLRDVVVGAAWRDLVGLLLRIAEEHRPVCSRVGPDGHLVATSVEAAVNSDQVDHLVLDFGGAA